MWYLMYIDENGEIGMSAANSLEPSSDKATLDARAVRLTANVNGQLRYFVCPACVVNLMRG